MTASSMSKDERREVLFALCAFMAVMFPGVLGAKFFDQHNHKQAAIMLVKTFLAFINQLQLACDDIDDQAMYRNLWQIGTATNNIDYFTYIDMDVIKDTEPA